MLTWVGWRANGGLARVHGPPTGRPVFGEIDAGTGERTETWSTTRAWARGRRTRPSSARTDSRSSDRVRSSAEVAIVQGGADGTVASFRHEGHDHAESHRASRALTWTAPDGLEIDGFLWPLQARAASADPQCARRSGVVLRGVVPSAEPRLARSARVRGADAEPSRFDGRGRAFLEAVIGDMGGGDAHDDLAGVDAVIERGFADPDRIAVTGGSYGGFMSCWLPTLDQRFKAAVAMSPVTDYFSQHWNSNIGAWDAWFLGGEPARTWTRYRSAVPSSSPIE